MADLKSALYGLDNDSDGRLSIEELQALLGKGQPGGRFSVSEAQRKVLDLFDLLVHPRSIADVEVERLFHEIDTDNKGSVRIEDFVFSFLHMTEFSAIWDRHLMLRIEQLCKSVAEEITSQRMLRHFPDPVPLEEGSGDENGHLGMSAMEQPKASPIPSILRPLEAGLPPDGTSVRELRREVDEMRQSFDRLLRAFPPKEDAAQSSRVEEREGSADKRNSKEAPTRNSKEAPKENGVHGESVDTIRDLCVEVARVRQVLQSLSNRELTIRI
jgi:hypothetical protein